MAGAGGGRAIAPGIDAGATLTGIFPIALAPDGGVTLASSPP